MRSRIRTLAGHTVVVALVSVVAAGITAASPPAPARVAASGAAASLAETSPIGFASANALGQNGTTGGIAGPTVTVTNATDLAYYAGRNTPYVIVVSGRITFDDMITVVANKSNIGVGLLDIKRLSDYVTVSWNHFHNHSKTALVGHSDTYYLDNGLYGVASTMNAGVLVEGNYFENVAHPSHVGYGESGPGRLVARDNVFVNSGPPEPPAR